MDGSVATKGKTNMATRCKPAAARKDAHIDLSMSPVTKSGVDSGFDRLSFDHCALPDLQFADLDLSQTFLGRPLSAPLMIGAMTGGTPRAEAINAALAEVAQSQKIAFAVGSQRAALELGHSAKNLRFLAPDIPIIGNLGAVQLAQGGGVALAQAAIEDLEADAIAIHLNPLQELIQPEGERDWRGVSVAIEALVKAVNVPVIVKEVGAGINADIAAQLFDMGVSAVDVAGAGGTNWARIEAARRKADTSLYDPFLDWGMTTIDCLLAVTTRCKGRLVIASGGVRHGLDVMRGYWLGADMVSVAGPMLRHLLNDNKTPAAKDLDAFVEQIHEQMRMTLFLTGAANLQTFREVAARLDGFRFNQTPD